LYLCISTSKDNLDHLAELDVNGMLNTVISPAELEKHHLGKSPFPIRWYLTPKPSKEETKEKDGKDFKCPVCLQPFCTKQNLSRHIDGTSRVCKIPVGYIEMTPEMFPVTSRKKARQESHENTGSRTKKQRSK